MRLTKIEVEEMLNMVATTIMEQEEGLEDLKEVLEYEMPEKRRENILEDVKEKQDRINRIIKLQDKFRDKLSKMK